MSKSGVHMLPPSSAAAAAAAQKGCVVGTKEESEDCEDTEDTEDCEELNGTASSSGGAGNTVGFPPLPDFILIVSISGNISRCLWYLTVTCRSPRRSSRVKDNMVAWCSS